MSRQELCRALKGRPNTIGDLVAGMIRQRVLREGTPRPRVGRGRLHVPVEIDPAGVGVVGLALRPSEISICRLNLLGEVIGEPETESNRRDPVTAAGRMLHGFRRPSDLAVGLSTTGFVDPQSRAILGGSSLAGRSGPVHTHATSLTPVYQSAGRTRITVDNDMHALAACWAMTCDQDPSEDLLLVQLEDGAIGAAMFVEGRPNRGCVISANELGHMRLAVQTPRCYCGQRGCIERIFSTGYLRSCSKQGGSLGSRLNRYASGDRVVHRITGHLAEALANACNFVRPHRLVLTGSVTDTERFTDSLIEQTRRRLLPVLSERITVEHWRDRPTTGAQVAGWLALASVFNKQWQQVIGAG